MGAASVLGLAWGVVGLIRNHPPGLDYGVAVSGATFGVVAVSVLFFWITRNGQASSLLILGFALTVVPYVVAEADNVLSGSKPFGLRAALDLGVWILLFIGASRLATISRSSRESDRGLYGIGNVLALLAAVLFMISWLLMWVPRCPSGPGPCDSPRLDTIFGSSGQSLKIVTDAIIAIGIGFLLVVIYSRGPVWFAGFALGVVAGLSLRLAYFWFVDGSDLSPGFWIAFVVNILISAYVVAILLANRRHLAGRGADAGSVGVLAGQ